MNIIEQAKLAKEASRQVRILEEEARNKVLEDFASNLLLHKKDILAANAQDIETARAEGMKSAMIDRLRLDEKRIEGIAEGIRQVESLPDPLHKVLEERVLSSGITLKKVSQAIGTIGIIYESRPNVTADCAALCFKAGSSCVLKGGKDSYASSYAIVSCFKDALRSNNMNENAVMLAEKPTHEETAEFMKCREYVDLLIPRGGKKLIQSVVNNATIPVIETGAGVCHTFVDASADFAMADRIIINAKCRRPSVCNAMETLLVHKDIAKEYIPHIASLLKENGVEEIYADEYAKDLVPWLKEADEESWYTEYNALAMNLKVVEGVKDAVRHIETYGTHHSECIVTEDADNASYFMENIDSAALYHNASTRFTDGFEFGLGAEIGISTQKLHARGPMGLTELTTYNYLLYGNGETR